MLKKKTLKNGNTYEIRNAEPEDAEQLINFLDVISAESQNLTFGPGELDITVDAEEKFIRDANDSKNQYFAVAVIDGNIIGNIVFTAGTKPRISHYGDLGVTVKKEYWGNGIGFELVNSLMEWAKENDITKINLQVREDNERAISLYKKMGFETEGLIRRTFFIDDTYYNSYQMGKILD